MKNKRACISYTVSPMEMVGLLLWNTSNYTNFAEFHIAKHLRIYTELRGRLVPSYKRIQNVELRLVSWGQYSEAHRQSCATVRLP
jgi:hypothetical protein